MYEVRAFGLAVHHWETGVLCSGWSYEDPSFYGCSIENNSRYGFRFAPTFLFGMGPEFASDLDAGLVTVRLQQEFTKYDAALGLGSTVIVEQAGSTWRINDGTVQYLIRKAEFPPDTDELK